MDSVWGRRLRCVSRDAEVPLGRGVLSVGVMMCLQILISIEQQSIPAFMPAEIKCNQSLCQLELNQTSGSGLDCDCINMTHLQEGSLLGPMTGAAYLLTSFITPSISSATSQAFVLVVGGFMWSGFVVLTSFTRVFWEIALSRLAVGMALAMCIPMATGLSSKIFDSPTTIHRTNLVYHLAIIFGVSCGYLLALRTSLICWQKALFILGLIGMCIALTTILTVKEPYKDQRNYMFKEGPTTKEFLTEVLKSKPFLVLYPAVILKNISSYALHAWLATYYAHDRHLTPQDYGLRLGMVVMCGGTTGALIGSLVMYRFKGENKALPTLIISLCQVVSTLCLPPALLSTPPSVSFVLLFIVFLGGETWWDCAVIVTKASLHSRLRHRATDFCLSSGLVIGSIVGPLFVTGIAHIHPGLNGCDPSIARPLLYVTASCSGLASLLFIILCLVIRNQTLAPSLEETIYLMYDTSDVESMSERSYSQRDSSF